MQASQATEANKATPNAPENKQSGGVSKNQKEKPSLVNGKNLVVYPIIVLSLAYTIPKLVTFKGYIDMLKLESPECTMSNPFFWKIFISTILILICVRRPVENYSTSFFRGILDLTKFPKGSKLREDKAQMLGERVFRFSINLCYVVMLYKILLQDDCDFLDSRIGGRADHPLYFANYPCQKIPANLDNFYVFKLAYHTFEQVYSLLYHRNRIDFPEYFQHHFMTLNLIFFSYSINELPIGAAVMILHDVTDLGMSICKITVDWTPKHVQTVGFACMLLPWIYFRLWYFQLHVIGRIYEEVWDSTHEVVKSVFYLQVLFLNLLGILHMFWFYLMIKGMLKRCKNFDKISFKSSENTA